MMQVILYTRDGCGLCDETKELLKDLHDEIPHKLSEVDIETDADLSARYTERIPVLKIGPYTLEAPIERVDIEVALRAAAASAPAAAPGSGGMDRSKAIGLNRALLLFARGWLAVFNIIVFLYVSLPFGAPYLMKVGAERPARLIYSVYKPLCHQLAYRSWFIFGEQAVYPLERTGLTDTSYEALTGNDPYNLSAGREFIGNEQAGYKVALCQRDVAIYGAIFVSGLLFGLVRKRVKPLPILAWAIFGILPLAVDGGSQLLGFVPLIDFPIRESTPLLRTLTGSLFGLMNVWLAYPYVEETMEVTRLAIADKLAAAGELAAKS
ncbi:MAG: DUF2085 domain-containing protein [Anaerolineales bacterium]|nr:DUF2085 domain-containing protein [Anaerolineales bacterium]